jgi:hypothetical protein
MSAIARAGAPVSILEGVDRDKPRFLGVFSALRASPTLKPAE